MTAIHEVPVGHFRQASASASASAGEPVDVVNAIIRSQRAAFEQAHFAKCAADAIEIRVLHVAQMIASARTRSASPSPHEPGSREQMQARHLRAIVGEFAVETRKSDASLMHRANHAHTLMTHYEQWVDELQAGRIEYAHTKGLVRHDELLTDEQRVEYGKCVLRFALKNTSGQTNRFAQQEASRIAREAFERAHAAARVGRCVSVSHEPAGMSTIYATIPTELAVPIDDLLTRQARALRDENKAEIEAHKLLAGSACAEDHARASVFEPDLRTIEQIRADLFADVLLTSTPQAILQSHSAGAARIKATVSVTVPVLSLLDSGVAEVDGMMVEGMMVEGSLAPALNGMHPMTVDQARQLAAEQPSLQRILTNPITGHSVCVDTYQPDASLRAFLRVRDQTCRFPGCMRAVANCDCDHTIPHAAGGPTAEWNLEHVCRTHHVQKHHRGWELEQLAGGVLRWTSPTGQLVDTEPRPPGPRFRPKIEALAPDPATTPPRDDPPPF